MPIREEDEHFKVDRRVPWIGAVGALWFVSYLLAATCPAEGFLAVWHVVAATILIIVSAIIFSGWVLEVRS